MSELARTLERITDGLTGESQYLTDIDSVILVRADQEKPPSHLLAKPALCVVAQGDKWTSFGSQRYRYGAGRALLVNVEMPSVGRVVQASADKPFLGIIIALDPYRLKATLKSLSALPSSVKAGANTSGAIVTAIDSGPLAQCILRLVQLLETP
ncbi:AraC family transcriptional regulator [Candidatus Sodalis endolongispinus]|uniref:AraC family transcriptional regulator n=1 Tax=Candidatus Sodalis endolongispinus TaxID=2812662 RepID=A0ABS5YES8_9GAMM|nr:AraC family transcriptional regulator [Candidatus Sodalis endolongispinus]MBT9433452.1 AraC family transcriptional regulator [Candidatus Sodalis endolongispinus]